ncbi:hypothetical protein BASA83_011489 [Batrachochytrium salamandrivorans]|nr:hypothetical protein BASA83_011489 [Batrachochytrium salamandrivorans]
MGLSLDILGWRDTIPKSIGSPEWWILDPVIVWRIVVLGRLGSKDLESLQEHRISRPSPSIPEQESSGQTSDSAVDSDIDASLFKNSIMDLDLGSNDQYLGVSIRHF